MLRSNAPSKSAQGKKNLLSLSARSSNISTTLNAVPEEEASSETTNEDVNNNNVADQDIIVISPTPEISTFTQTDQKSVIVQQRSTVQGCFNFFKEEHAMVIMTHTEKSSVLEKESIDIKIQANCPEDNMAGGFIPPDKDEDDDDDNQQNDMNNNKDDDSKGNENETFQNPPHLTPSPHSSQQQQHQQEGQQKQQQEQQFEQGMQQQPCCSYQNLQQQQDEKEQQQYDLEYTGDEEEDEEYDENSYAPLSCDEDEIFEDTQEDEVEDEVAEEGIKGESVKDTGHCNDDSDYDDPVQDELNASGIGKGTYGGLRGGAPTTRRRKPKDGEKAGEKRIIIPRGMRKRPGPKTRSSNRISTKKKRIDYSEQELDKGIQHRNKYTMEFKAKLFEHRRQMLELYPKLKPEGRETLDALGSIYKMNYQQVQALLRRYEEKKQ